MQKKNDTKEKKGMGCYKYIILPNAIHKIPMF